MISAAHCATRLRLVIGDNEKCDSKAVETIDGVKGVFFSSGQLQIILGTGTVNKVYAEFIQIAGVFVPIIPAIVASGFLMGIMEALNFMVNNGFLQIDTSGSIYQFAVLFSNVAYVFLPILIAYSAAKVFGANPYLGAVIGMIMIHPNLQNAWSVATEGVQHTQKVFFGLWEIDMVGYQGHVIPVIIAVFVLSVIEKKLHKIVPPVFVFVENSLLGGIQKLLTLPFGIGSFVMGGLYALAVAFKSKNKKIKSVALPSALSACMGITEPAIFGVNLRFVRPFIVASAQSAELCDCNGNCICIWYGVCTDLDFRI